MTFLAYEWTNWTYGHQHVLFLNSEDGEVFSFRDHKSSSPDKLWQCLKGIEALTIPHHVGGGPIAYDWNFYNAQFQPLTEICSIHGNCEFFGAPKGIYSPQKGHFVRYALARGYRLGIVASGDSHNGHPGRRDPGAPVAGLVGIYARTLTRESVWKALTRRNVYATSGVRIIVSFSINGHTMGEIVESADRSEIRELAGEVIGTDDLQKITVIKNGFDLYSIKGDGIRSTLYYTDRITSSGNDFYYLRVEQKDGEMAWSSPIWFTHGGEVK